MTRRTNKSRTCPACGVVVLTNHVCQATALMPAPGWTPTAPVLMPATPTYTPPAPKRPCGQCEKGWITFTRPDGSEYVAKCPKCPPWVRSNHQRGGR